MKNILIATLAFTLAAAIPAWALAQTGRGPSASQGTGYELTWYTIDGGGGTSSGGAYSLGGTVGQPDAGRMTGGVYTLIGGFWGGGVSGAMSWYVYLPIILR